MSSRKGSAFEREIAVTLSEWWSEGLGKKRRDDIFWRSSSSGARATIRTKAGKRTSGHYGDLCAIDPIGAPFIDVFTIELKNGYSSHTLMNVLDRPATAKMQQYEEWFSNLEQSHLNAGSLGWMLIHKRTRREPMAFISWRLSERLGLHVLPIDRLFSDFTFASKTIELFCLKFSLFLNLVEPKRIVELSKKA